MTWSVRFGLVTKCLTCPLYPIQDEVLTVFAKTALSPKEVCGAIIGSSCGSEYDPFHQKWNITIPGNKPPVYRVPAPIVSVALGFHGDGILPPFSISDALKFLVNEPFRGTS